MPYGSITRPSIPGTDGAVAGSRTPEPGLARRHGGGAGPCAPRQQHLPAGPGDNCSVRLNLDNYFRA